MNFSPRFVSRATTYQVHVRHELDGWRTANHVGCVTDTLFCASHPIWSFVTNQRPTSIWQKSVQGKRERERERVITSNHSELVSCFRRQLPRSNYRANDRHYLWSMRAQHTRAISRVRLVAQGSRVQQEGNVSQERAHLAQWKRTLDSWLDTRYRHTNYQRDVRFLHIHWCASSNNEILPSIRIRQRQGSTSRRSINSRPSFTGLDNVSRHSFPDMHFCGEISVRFSLRRTPR